MLIKRTASIRSSEITPEDIYLNRRTFIGKSIGVAALLNTGVLSSFSAIAGRPYEIDPDIPTYRGPGWLEKTLDNLQAGPFRTDEELTPYLDVIRYNNFYEFGSDKQDPAKNAQAFKTDPWSVEIAGEALKTGVFHLEDILKPHALEERIYRLRCVEAWSMVVPWVGFSMGELLKRFEPTSKAKYVEFTTLVDKEQMSGQASAFSTIDWPYVEGLRMDEAMHPLSIFAVGLYGRAMPPQNGAPLRIVIPWKYGFKSIKSIVKIRFTEQAPVNTWQQIAPREYGFYANVNPAVDHPRWSQKLERRLPSTLFDRNTMQTLPFNGYAEQVAQLYSGMDLTKWF
ncbi:protein-methionine-sulfoxide reductase catalytic subunit MsrP [Motiliproteus sp. MSK22-1]|uniref:protein-methionine-sulfoxide reductase catalytic subunit MsrP n=1 Tax=Motiliproteus sp. MSK22-1 TaxID=1897630 RepID=UPI0009762174|nr:protein-methionine-sulfoxide reductase catalytic subunit MsrP [Motiliproteus sp. MSK22-1]OMH38664.1 mononuclear molybdenum enzyme YedY [Motiliproteus sp. MSK22-1]